MEDFGQKTKYKDTKIHLLDVMLIVALITHHAVEWMIKKMSVVI